MISSAKTARAAGGLRKRAVLQAEQRTADAGGGYVLAWTDLATVWARLMPVSGRESLAADRLEARVTHRVTMRWRADLNLSAALRLKIGARLFNIHAVFNEGERDRTAILLVEEGGAE